MIRRLAIALVLALVLGACTSDGASVDSLDSVDSAPTASSLEASGAPASGDGVAPPVLADEVICVDTPETAACQAFFDELSDAEFCALQPDDVFCTEFFDPDRNQGGSAGDEGVGRISVEDLGRLRPGVPDETDGEPEVPVNDPSMRRLDGLCLPRDATAEWADADYDVAYQVVEATLGAACHGMPDPRLEAVWDVVRDLAPAELAARIAVFAGYFNETASDRSRVGSAFVRPVGTAGEFLMAYNLVDLGRTSQDPSVIVAHELAHVIANSQDQIAGPPTTDCPTYVDGHGCRAATAIMNRWFDEFWADVPQPFDTSFAAERCEADNGYFGEYAATEPAEDFAETVAAYVTGVRAESFGQQDRIDFVAAIPAVRALRDRAEAAGYTAAWYPFTVCG